MLRTDKSITKGMNLCSTVAALMLLCGAWGLPDPSIAKRETADGPPDPASCVLQAIISGRVARACGQGLLDARSAGEKRDVACSAVCDSLYSSLENCVEEEKTRAVYSDLCTNGYHGPSG